MSTLFWGCDEQADSPALGHLCSEKQKQAYSCAHMQLSSGVLLLPCFWESLWLVCVATGACCSCVCHLNCQWHWRKPILKSLCYIILLTSGQQLFFSSHCGNPNLLYTKCLLLQVLMLGNENMHIQLCVLLKGREMLVFFFFLFFFLSPVF